MEEIKEKEKTLKTNIVLPKKIIPASAVVPESMILFGLAKCGKTTILSELSNCLLIDTENGANFVDALKVQPEKDAGPVSKFLWLKKVAQQIKDEGRPYDFVAIDTLSYLDEIAEWVGTFNYMQRKGNKWNVHPNGTLMKPTDEGYESVHMLPEGYGYRWSREAMLDIFDSLKGLGKICTIFICHVADKFVLSKQTNQEVRVIDLSLTGKLRNIIARDVDAIGYVWNDDGTMHISFKGNEEKVGGIRGSKHIQGYEGPLDWKQIFKLK